jgi:hypothetical protein
MRLLILILVMLVLVCSCVQHAAPSPRERVATSLADVREFSQDEPVSIACPFTPTTTPRSILKVTGDRRQKKQVRWRDIHGAA